MARIAKRSCAWRRPRPRATKKPRSFRRRDRRTHTQPSPDEIPKGTHRSRIAPAYGPPNRATPHPRTLHLRTDALRIDAGGGSRPEARCRRTIGCPAGFGRARRANLIGAAFFRHGRGGSPARQRKKSLAAGAGESAHDRGGHRSRHPGEHSHAGFRRSSLPACKMVVARGDPGCTAAQCAHSARTGP